VLEICPVMQRLGEPSCGINSSKAPLYNEDYPPPFKTFSALAYGVLDLFSHRPERHLSQGMGYKADPRSAT